MAAITAQLAAQGDPAALREVTAREKALAAQAAGVKAPERDAPTAELIAALAAPNWVAQATAPRAADAIAAELGDRKSYRLWLKLCAEVVGGERPVDSLLEPWRKLQDRIARGARPDRPGGYLLRSVQTWDAERGRAAS